MYSLHPRMFAWNWLSGSWEKDFMKIFLNCLFLFRYIHLLEKGGALNLNKLESPSPKDALCKVWLKLAQWFWRRRLLNVVNLFLLFHNYLPFEKGVALHLNKLEYPSPKDALCQFGWNWPSTRGSGEEDENVKSLQTEGQTDRQTTDDRWSEKLTWAFSSGELKSLKTGISHSFQIVIQGSSHYTRLD